MKYVFPCIIEKNKDLYSITFPDLDGKKLFGTDLYDVLKTAHNVMLIELYVKEAQRIVVPSPSSINELNLNSGQTATYITCDTDILSNMLDLYDNVQTNDLEEFLQEKADEAEAYENSIEPQNNEIQNSEGDIQEELSEQSASDEELLDYVDDIEVIDNASKTPEIINNAEKISEPIAKENQQNTKKQSLQKQRYNNYRPPKKKKI